MKKPEDTEHKALYHISGKSFLNVIIILSTFIIISAVLVYIIPAGSYENGVYTAINADKYPIYKLILSPILMLTDTSSLMSFLGLCLFIIFVSGAFQIMKDSNGMSVLLKKIVNKFEKRKTILMMLITLFFMLFGSIYGIFEESLILVPLIVGLSLALGWDTLTGLGMSVLAVGLGFGAAMTNPFSIGIASEELQISALSGIGYRIIIFVITYAILVLFLKLHISKIEKNPMKSISYTVDQTKDDYDISTIKETKFENEKKIGIIYGLFFIGILVVILTVYSIPQISGYSIVILAAYFLIVGSICGFILFDKKKDLFKALGVGYKSALPSVVMIMLALTIKFIIYDAHIAPTITNYCVIALESMGPYKSVLALLGIVFVLEFFVSSSTAKAVLVMGVLAPVIARSTLSANTMVLAYIMGDGFTNVIFPTSPVLLLALSMVGLKYRDWLKWTKWLFIILFALNIVYLMIAVAINY